MAKRVSLVVAIMVWSSFSFLALAPPGSAHHQCETTGTPSAQNQWTFQDIPPYGYPDLAIDSLTKTNYYNPSQVLVGYTLQIEFSNNPDPSCNWKWHNYEGLSPGLVDGNSIAFNASGDHPETDGSHTITYGENTWTIPCPHTPCQYPATYWWQPGSSGYTTILLLFASVTQPITCFDATINKDGTTYPYQEHDDGGTYNGDTMDDHGDNWKQVNVKTVAINPSGSIQTRFSVHNPISSTIAFSVSIDAPEGWDVEVNPAAFNLGGDSWQTLTVDVTAPGTITEYPTIEILAHDETTGGWFDNLSELILEAPA